MAIQDLYEMASALYQVLTLCASDNTADPAMCEWLAILLLAQRNDDGTYSLTAAGRRLLQELTCRLRL